jgi:hypothetical protein
LPGLLSQTPIGDEQEHVRAFKRWFPLSLRALNDGLAAE